ncbi:ribosomal protein S6 kinase-related protein-like isoform X3 [Scyliorhinus canicula]|uniref:ribosomal protein S6 kinase-related protein-like isoform X3 n=1 Tax=Scyliorhinus canicula TaxID=7830 RepID=UPI0018F5DB16|nr:ribosomal protein S6 kinase-related protein-like isoform X3 [Scyliorhinus canicula]
MGSEQSAARAGVPLGRRAPLSEWKSVLSGAGSSLSSWHTLDMFQRGQRKVPEPLGHSKERVPSNNSRNTGWPFPQFIALFFPVFPYRSRQVLQEFQDIEFIAKGSFGPILKVCQRSDEQIYAVKVLLKAEVVRQGILQQCKDGVIIQKQVDHPFVQGLRECWQTSRLLFIMCDYQGAGDLHMLWRDCAPFAEGRARVFAAELGSAIGFLHDIGVVHRDVKMENVLLNDRGHLRLTDFGFCRRLCRGERAHTICGTIQYMAPEVLRGSPYNHTADWWSLGVLLFALVTGKLLCGDPGLRLHRLGVFRAHRFFQGLSFDPDSLQKLPLEMNHSTGKLSCQIRPNPSLFRGFDWELPCASKLPLAG